MLKKRMSFSKVRNAHKTENTEDYLELIAELLNSKGEARIVDIAESLGIAQATANKTIQRLQTQGYIKREPYRSIFLTFKGQKIASESKKRHNIVYNFLLNLGLDKNTASEDAEGIEHHVSEKTLRKMDNFNSKNKFNLLPNQFYLVYKKRRDTANIPSFHHWFMDRK